MCTASAEFTLLAWSENFVQQIDRLGLNNALRPHYVVPFSVLFMYFMLTLKALGAVQRHAVLTPAVEPSAAATPAVADNNSAAPSTPPATAADCANNDTAMEGDDGTSDGTGGTAMDCIDGNSVWQHMLTCFDPGCPDPLCVAGKTILMHRLSCEVSRPSASFTA